MIRSILILLVLFAFLPAKSQKWKLADSGVGLIVSDENYDKKLRIVERNNVWDAKELYENGAQAGKYKGNQLFAAWLEGPPTSSYVNNYGTPVWMYKYRITYPDGKTFEAGPAGFYQPGFTYFNINTGGYTTGNWKIEWWIVHRDTQESRLVATNEFKTTYGKPENTTVTGWKAKDIGIGLFDQSEYDKVLKVIKRGDTWSQKELYENGYFANREKVFGTWIEGPPVNTYLDKYGVPLWMAKFEITYPDGNKQVFGPYGFYAPGFLTQFINASGNVMGKWKIDYFLVDHGTLESKKIDSREFTLNP